MPINTLNQIYCDWCSYTPSVQTDNEEQVIWEEEHIQEVGRCNACLNEYGEQEQERKVMKVLTKNYDDNKTDSMFYPDMRVLEVEHKGRKFELNTYGEVKIIYQDEIYYDLNEICSSDEQLNKLCDNDELDILYNNWYELRPIGRKDYYDLGMYDEVYGDPTEITEEVLDEYITLEKGK